MKHPLEKWIIENGMTKAQFAKLVNLTAMSIGRYCSSQRLPNLDALKKIHEATDGEITFKDFEKKESA